MADCAKPPNNQSAADKLARNLARVAKVVPVPLSPALVGALVSHCTKFERLGIILPFGPDGIQFHSPGFEYVFGFGQIELAITRICVSRDGKTFPLTLVRLIKAPPSENPTLLPSFGWIMYSAAGANMKEPVPENRACLLSITTDWIHPKLTALLYRLGKEGTMRLLNDPQISNPSNSVFVAPADVAILAQAMGVPTSSDPSTTPDTPSDETLLAMDLLCFAAIEDMRAEGVIVY